MVKSSTAAAPKRAALPPLPPPSHAVGRAGSSAIRDLLEITERPEIISLAGGLPTPAAFPIEEIASATAAVLADAPEVALQYGATEGDLPLRAWLADGYGVDLASVTVTSGSQQAIELVARATTDPGQTVALADPGYVGAIQAFRSAGADLVGIPSDRDGMQVDALAHRLAAGLRPTLVYVVATFDNPTGATLTLERRRALADLADRYGFWIVDDDPYGALRWSGAAVVPLRDLSDRVISLGTVSKTLAPGLRVGWAVGPAVLARSLVVLKQATDLHTGSLAQHVVRRVVTEPGFLARHLPRIADRYRQQADVLVSALDHHLGDRLSFVRPDGGMFLWAEVAADGGDVDTTDLLDSALAAGVAFVPGSAFAVEASHRCRLRLSFATTTEADLDEGVRRLASAVRGLGARGARPGVAHTQSS